MVSVKRLSAAALLFALVASAVWASGRWRRDRRADSPCADVAVPARHLGGMVPVPGGTFRMGSDLSADPDQRPAHDVYVGAFRIDEHEVTNRQFAEFVDQTGYITTAEQRGWSHVFDRRDARWIRQPGADWRHPRGPDSALHGRDEYPVVHISWYDAQAYARWAGKRLPTEAEWEYAARSALRDAKYPWGRDELIDGRYQANYRQHGQQPAADGFEAAAPVRSFPASPFGLYDMSGNVWEWCGDWYDEDCYREGPGRNPTGPAQGRQRVLRGGSWLSPENYRFGHHVSTREKRAPEETYEHIGFRCVRPTHSRR